MNRLNIKSFDVEAKLKQAKLLEDLFFDRKDVVAFRNSRGIPNPGTWRGGKTELQEVLHYHVFGEFTKPFALEFENNTVFKPNRIGVYLLNPDRNTVKAACVDVDGIKVSEGSQYNGKAKTESRSGHAVGCLEPDLEAKKIVELGREVGVNVYLEKTSSGSGWHTWIFFSEQVDAGIAKKLLWLLAPRNAKTSKGGIAEPGKSPLEVFPKQAKAHSKKLGNMVWLPFWHGAKQGNNQFYSSSHLDESICIESVDEVSRYTQDQCLAAIKKLEDMIPKEERIEVTQPEPKAKAEKTSPLERSKASETKNKVSSENLDWKTWREKALEALDLKQVYGSKLTDQKRSNGWIWVHTDRSLAGGRLSAGVSDGTGTAEKGKYHDFESGKSLSVFDYIIDTGTASDHIAACKHLAKLTGIKIPKSELELEYERQAMEATIEANQFESSLDNETETQTDSNEIEYGFGIESEDEQQNKKETKDPAKKKHGKLSEIMVNHGDLERLESETWSAVKTFNGMNPSYFRYNSKLSTVGIGDFGEAKISTLCPRSIQSELAKIAYFYEGNGPNKSVKNQVHPPLTLASGLDSSPVMPLPFLHRVVSTPFFNRQGELIVKHGYDPVSSCYLYLQNQNGSIGKIPSKPTEKEVSDSIGIISNHLEGFPFADEASRSNAISLFFLPFIRDLIDGPTPLHLIEAPEKGTGKGMLAESLLYPFVGSELHSIQVPKSNDDEWRKQIVSSLLPSPQVILFDNIVGKLDNAPLCSLLTQRKWSARILGESRDATFLIVQIFVATGNNCRVEGDMQRRTLLIRLDAKTARPWERSNFKYKLPDFVKVNRWKIIESALILIKHWLGAGAPEKEISWGSYEDYAKKIGGLVEFLGFRNWNGNAGELRQNDKKELALLDLIRQWWINDYKPELLGTTPRTAKELVFVADQVEYDFGKANGEKAKATRIGMLLAPCRGRVFELDMSSEYGTEKEKILVRLDVAENKHHGIPYKLSFV